MAIIDKCRQGLLTRNARDLNEALGGPPWDGNFAYLEAWHDVAFRTLKTLLEKEKKAFPSLCPRDEETNFLSPFCQFLSGKLHGIGACRRPPSTVEF